MTKLHANRVKFENGKFTPVPNSEFEINADLVLLAMGFTGPVKNGLLDSLGVKYDARGAVAVDEHFMTNLDGVFAAAIPNAVPHLSSGPLPRAAKWRQGSISICKRIGPRKYLSPDLIVWTVSFF